MIERLFYLLAALVEAVKRHLRRKEQEQAQGDRDRLEDDAVGWYNQHFDGVPHDANDADQADADRRAE